jgi:hypothetical protein
VNFDACGLTSKDVVYYNTAAGTPEAVSDQTKVGTTCLKVAVSPHTYPSISDL